MEELIVRIENLLQLKESKNLKQESETKLGEFTFNPAQYKLSYKETSLKLSHRENELVILLSKNVNQKIDRREILKQVWGDDSLYNSRNLDVYIRKVRTYFESDPRIKLITLRGYGYHFSIED